MTFATNRPAPEVVVTDTNVLINFLHLAQLPLLGSMCSYRCAVPNQVVDEITRESQALALAASFECRHIDRCDTDDSATRDLFADLCTRIEIGEAACIAIAFMRGHLVATDEKKHARRIAIEMLGERRLLRTEDVIWRCVEEGLITIPEADAFKARLAELRYVMDFSSFADMEPA